MADFSSFSDPNFDPKKWINDALGQSRSQESIHQLAATLRMKLQLLSTELGSNLEELSTRCLARIPRAIRDIEQIRKEATTLKSRLNEFEERIRSLEDGTEESIQMLAELDEVKSQMEACNKLVQEAEKFKQLLRSMDSVFENQDNKKIAATLHDLNSSYDVLKDIPEFQTYRHSVALYTEKLESLVRPRLLHAFNQHNSEEAAEAVEILNQIGRSEQVHEFYYKARMVSLSQLWKSFDSQASTQLATTPAPTSSFAKWLPGFYDELLQFLATESRWLATVFGEKHPSMLGTLLQEFLKSIRESFEGRLAVQPLDSLIQMYTISKNFSKNVGKLLSALPMQLRHNLQFSVIKPFLSFHSKYASLEKAYLNKEFAAFKPQMGDFLATINGIDNSMPRLFLLAESSIERCIEFTEGAEAEGLVNVLSGALVDYLEQVSHLLKHLRKLAGLAPGSKHEQYASVSGTQFQDWRESYFQGALQLLEIIGKFSHRLHAFAHTLKSHFSQQQSALFGRITQPDEIEKESIANMCLPLFGSFDKAKKVLQLFKQIDEAPDSAALFPAVEKTYNEVSAAAHEFVFDTMFNYVREKLSTVPTLEVWKRQPPSGIMLEAQFSLSPSAYIKMITEYLLLLPEMLEPYNHNEAIQISQWEQNSDSASIGSTNSTDVPSELLEPDWADESSKGSPQADQHQRHGFAKLWILQIVKATMSTFVQQILNIPQLSVYGSEQLAVDIGHLLTTVAVLQVDKTKHLELIQSLLKTPAEQYSEYVKTLQAGGERNVAIIIGKKRGITINT